MVLIAEKPLLQLSAQDLMSRSVVTIPEHMTLQGAARILSRSQITGAPIVDADGRCVGVLSSTDYLHWAEKGGKPVPAQNYRCASWQMIEPDVDAETRVGDVMNRDPVMVHAGTRIGELARMMLDARIHRVIVVDAERRPIGVVATMDILAVLARADSNQEGSMVF